MGNRLKKWFIRARRKRLERKLKKLLALKWELTDRISLVSFSSVASLYQLKEELNKKNMELLELNRQLIETLKKIDTLKKILSKED